MSIPRACGDEPTLKRPTALMALYSPRMRG